MQSVVETRGNATRTSGTQARLAAEVLRWRRWATEPKSHERGEHHDEICDMSVHACVCGDTSCAWWSRCCVWALDGCGKAMRFFNVARKEGVSFGPSAERRRISNSEFLDNRFLKSIYRSVLYRLCRFEPDGLTVNCGGFVHPMCRSPPPPIFSAPHHRYRVSSLGARGICGKNIRPPPPGIFV